MWSDVEKRVAGFLAEAKRPLAVIVGPTASGKTDLSLRIATRFDGEIINADSRQLYSRLDIGTGKIDVSEMKGVPHHLFSVVDPSASVNIGWYQRHARAAIDDIRTRGRLPIMSGGSMLYISSIIDGLEPLPSDPQMRATLEKESSESLHSTLKRIDPEVAAATDPRNRVYLVRAMELAMLGKKKGTSNVSDDLIMIGLSVDRESLRRRVEERVRTMFAAGWGDEVRGLLESGVSIDAPSMESVGYREIADALMRWDPAQNAIPEIVSRTMRYAKRQMTWWKNDKRIHWVKS